MRDELVELLIQAIPNLCIWQTVGDIARVGAFALCTDENLSTLFATAAPTDWLEQNDESRFWPPDWPWEENGDSSIHEPGELLAHRYDLAEDISAHVDTSFDHLVQALAFLRQDKFFPPEATLLVCATTPTRRVLGKATAAVATLNNAHVVQLWRAYWKLDPVHLLGMHIDDGSVVDFLANHGGRHIVDDRDEDPAIDRYVTSATSGVELSLDHRDLVRVVFLYLDRDEGRPEFDGQLPLGLSRNMTRTDVRKLHGLPAFERSPTVHPILGSFGLADRYDLASYSVHLEYAEHTGKLALVTVMAASAVPGFPDGNVGPTCQ